MSKQQTLRYDAALEKLSQKAEANTKAVLSKVLPTLRGQDLPFETTCELILHSAQGFRQSAATLAEELLMKQEGMKWTEPQLKDYRIYVEKTLEKYRSRLENGDIDDFIKEASSISGDLVNMSANAQMTLGQRAGVKFARVPIYDAKVCMYCIMQASRGFVFASEAKAWAVSHQRCRCRVLPETAAKAVGYNESLFEKLYDLDVRNHYGQGYADKIRRRKDQLKAFGFEGDLEGIENSVFYEATGIPEEVVYLKPREECTTEEIKVAETLASTGLKVVVNTQNDSAIGNIDFMINGQFNETKNIEAAHKQRVHKTLSKANHQIKKATGEENPYISVSISSEGSPMPPDFIWEEIKNRSYYYDEVIYITPDGGIRFYKK